jgi:putative DNA primase/helicase
MPLPPPAPTAALSARSARARARSSALRFAAICVVVVLWSAATYLHSEFEIFQFLAITAQSKRCGKTKLFTLVSKFVPRALVLAGDVSAPFVFRAINAYAPALMLDEAQDAFRKNLDLASIYNAGHVKDTAYVGRVEKINEDLVPVRFNVFCPKVLALKGKIRMTRRKSA